MNETLHRISRAKRTGILSNLRGGFPPSDGEFDELFSVQTRQLSSMHWTPVEVAIRAAEMLVTERGSRILDVGCGPGKFCLIGAMTQDATFTGVDQRGHLLNEGESIARASNIPNVEFIHANMVDLDWSEYGGFYLYNPFLENMTRVAMIDETVPLRPEYFYKYVAVVQEKLRDLPLGTRVVTYHGFGGDMPYGYRMIENRIIGSDALQCWSKEKEFDYDSAGMTHFRKAIPI